MDSGGTIDCEPRQ